MVGNDLAAFYEFLERKGRNAQGAPARVKIFLNSTSGGFSDFTWNLTAFDALGVLVHQESDPDTPRFFPWGAIVGFA